MTSLLSINRQSDVIDLEAPDHHLPASSTHCLLFLNTRSCKPTNGTLLVALSNGTIQVWSHHDAATGAIAEFDAIHVAGDVSKCLIDVHFVYSDPLFVHVVVDVPFLSFSSLIHSHGNDN